MCCKIDDIMRKNNTDLTDEQWNEIVPLSANMRERKWKKCELLKHIVICNTTFCRHSRCIVYLLSIQECKKVHRSGSESDETMGKLSFIL